MLEERKSLSHAVEIVPVVLGKHENADSLSVVSVFGGYSCVVRTQDWIGIERAAYIPPDSIVYADRPEFAFLIQQAKPGPRLPVRIKAKKLRGVVSFGLLVPAPADTNLGDDVAERLEVQHYEPETEFAKHEKGFSFGGDVASAPNLPFVFGKYDIENLRRYPHEIQDGEPCFVSEKLDGESAVYVYWDGDYHCKSRTLWKKEFPSHDNVTVEKLVEAGKSEDEAKEIVERLNFKEKPQSKWWRVLRQTPLLEKFLRDNPGVVVFGENFGHVQKLRYGHLPNQISLGVFDIMKGGAWLDPLPARDFGIDLPWAPMVSNCVPYEFNTVCAMAEGQSLWPGADNIREGCVIAPLKGRWTRSVGRLTLKAVSGNYLEKFH